ncbi:MAG: LUD domain-containing protein [Flavobacteriales bacterium]
MSILKWLKFNDNRDNSVKPESRPDVQNKVQPNSKLEESTIPTFENLDEQFAYMYTQSGGKFMFFLSEQALKVHLEKLIDELRWQNIFTTESQFNYLKNKSTLCSKPANTDAMISSCDGLIAFDGRIMISSNQTHQFNLSQLPNIHIIVATPKQITKNMSEVMRQIAVKYPNTYPSKITPIKPNKTSGRQLYVFLVEDYSYD